MTRIDESLTPQATRLTPPRLAVLKRDDPPVLAAFADISRPVALALLAPWPDPQDARRRTVSEVLPWRRPHREPRAAQEAPRIWRALQQRAWDASPGQRRAPVWAVRALVAPLQALHTEPQALREHLAELFGASPDADLWMRGPGVAVTGGARRQAGWGPDRDRFERAEAVPAGAGTRPVL